LITPPAEAPISNVTGNFSSGYEGTAAVYSGTNEIFYDVGGLIY